MRKAIDWITLHDSKRLFIVLYIGLSLVLSVAISLFWLLFAVLIHLVFELIAQSRRKEGFGNVLLESLWETKLDFALLMFALWLAVYLDFIFGVAGIGAMARGGAHAASRATQVGAGVARTGARFATLTRVIRGILLSVDDVANALRAYFVSRKTKKGTKTGSQNESVTIENEAYPTKTSWSSKWGKIDIIGVAILVVFTLLIALAPLLIAVSWDELLQVIKWELRPLPSS